MTQSHPPSQKLPPLTKQTEGDAIHPPTPLSRGVAPLQLRPSACSAPVTQLHKGPSTRLVQICSQPPLSSHQSSPGSRRGVRSHPAKDPAPQLPAVREKPECTILPYHHTESSTQDSGNTHTLSSNGSHGNDLFFRFFGVVRGHPGVLRAILKDTEHQRGVYALSTIAQKNQDQSGS